MYVKLRGWNGWLGKYTNLTNCFRSFNETTKKKNAYCACSQANASKSDKAQLFIDQHIAFRRNGISRNDLRGRSQFIIFAFNLCWLILVSVVVSLLLLLSLVQKHTTGGGDDDDESNAHRQTQTNKFLICDEMRNCCGQLRHWQRSTTTVDELCTTTTKIRCILWIIEKICKHFYRIIHERIGRLHHTHTQLLTCCGAVQCLVYEERKENNIVRDVSSSITVNSDIPAVTPALRLCWFY